MRTQIFHEASANKQIFAKQGYQKFVREDALSLNVSTRNERAYNAPPIQNKNVLEMCTQPVRIVSKTKRALTWVSFLFCWWTVILEYRTTNLHTRALLQAQLKVFRQFCGSVINRKTFIFVSSFVCNLDDLYVFSGWL